jgi:hypothetical protein
MQSSHQNHNSHMTGFPRSRDRVHFSQMYSGRRNIMRRLLVLLAAVCLSSTLNSQLSISLGFNVDRQPVWGPTGYDHVEYYYLPDIEVYYNVPQHRYYYNERGRWIGS